MFSSKCGKESDDSFPRFFVSLFFDNTLRAVRDVYDEVTTSYSAGGDTEEEEKAFSLFLLCSSFHMIVINN